MKELENSHHKNLPTSKNVAEEQLLLKKQILTLQEELNHIQQEIHIFEATLRSHLSDMIIEANELFILYKKIKKAKKVKRLEQKKRGKNYKEPKGIKPISKKKEVPKNKEAQKERRQLYREAMLHVHPDKFTIDSKENEVATEITSQLIQIYESGDLERLRAYHAHIFSGNVLSQIEKINTKSKKSLKDTFLQDEIKRLKKELELIKNRHIYKVLKEYENPIDYLDEVKAYYEDRIFKLRKRTRKGL